MADESKDAGPATVDDTDQAIVRVVGKELRPDRAGWSTESAWLPFTM